MFAPSFPTLRDLETSLRTPRKSKTQILSNAGFFGSFFTTKYFLIGLVIVLAISAAIMIKMVRNHMARNKRHLKQLDFSNDEIINEQILNFPPQTFTNISVSEDEEYPVYGLTSSTTALAAVAETPTIDKSNNLLYKFRPYNPLATDDFFGIINITNRKSVKLTVYPSPQTNGYFEVVIYKYPEWRVVYSETSINELYLDFLPAGEYASIIYSIAPIEGVLETCRNNKRPKPNFKSHRLTNQHVIDLRNAANDSFISSIAPNNAEEYEIIDSKPVFMFPGTVYTRVENITTNLFDLSTTNENESVKEAFLVLPSYGYVVEGAEKHIGALIHESNNSAIYRIKNNTGNWNEQIKISVVYPDIDTKMTENSPSTNIYAFF